MSILSVSIVAILCVPQFLLGHALRQSLLSNRHPFTLSRAAGDFFVGVPCVTLLLLPFLPLVMRSPSHAKISVVVLVALAFLLTLWVRKRLEGADKAEQTPHRNGAPVHQTEGALIPPAQRIVLVILCLLILTSCIYPLLKIASPVEGGYAVRAYFSADYLKHMAVTGEVAKGEIPPKNPYFFPNTLHYYWLFYVIPALVTACGASPLHSLIAYQLLLDLAFLVLFIQVIRERSQSSPTVVWIFLFATLAISYEGLYVFKDFSPNRGGILHFIRGFNIDAATRWFIGHPQFDSLYRTMIYTPQHLTAVAFLLLIIQGFHDRQETKVGRLQSLYQGFLAISAFLWSAIVGAVILLWLALVRIVEFLVAKKRLKGEALFNGFFTGIPVIVGVALLLSLKMVSLGHNYFEWVMLPIQSILKILFLNFGILLLLGVGALVVPHRRRQWREFVLLGLALVFSLCLRIKDYPSDIGLKVGLVVIVALAVSGVHLLDALMAFKGKNFTRLLFVLLGLAMLAALPTIGIDVFNSGDIHNRRFTTLVSTEDMAVARWMAKNLPPTAVLQESPAARAAFYSLLPTFAQRRITAGDTMHSHIFQIPWKEYLQRKGRIQELYSTRNPFKARRICDTLGIDYLLFGGAEQRDYGSQEKTFLASPALFEVVYRNRHTYLFKVRHQQGDGMKGLLREAGKILITNPSRSSRMHFLLTQTPAEKGTLQKGKGILQGYVAPQANKTITVPEIAEQKESPGRGKVRLSMQCSFPIRVTYNANQLHTLIGKKNTNGATLTAARGKQGFIVYGPYHVFPSGTYTIQFEVELNKSEVPPLALLDKPCITADIYAPDRKKILRKKEFNSADIEQSPVTLKVKLEHPEKLEFRLYSLGAFSLIFRAVNLTGGEDPLVLPLKP